MRRADTSQAAMFSYRTLEERIPAKHPLRKLRVLVDGILGSMHGTFEKLYSRIGRPGIPPERLLRASLLQVLFSIRSERQLVQHIEYNLLYRWFVGLGMDEGMWAATSFTENRQRLFTEPLMREFFGKVLALAQWKKLSSHDHFTVDGTLIEAWASHKSFVPKNGSGNPPGGGGKNPEADFKGTKRKNDTHASRTDPESRLFRKSDGERRGARAAVLHGACADGEP
jgi:transposase